MRVIRYLSYQVSSNYLSTLLLSLTLACSFDAYSAMVWSQSDLPHSNIYYSENGQHITQLTQAGNHHTPSLYLSEHGSGPGSGSEAYIAWVDNSSGQQSYFRIVRVGLSGNVQTVSTLPVFAANSVYAPSIAYHSESKVLWLVWAQFDGSSTDLWFSTLNNPLGGNDWSKPSQITQTDEYSAELPQIVSVSSKGIKLQWLQSSRSGSKIITSNLQTAKQRQKFRTLKQLTSVSINSLHSSIEQLQKSSVLATQIQQLSPDKRIWSATEHAASQIPNRVRIDQ